MEGGSWEHDSILDAVATSFVLLPVHHRGHTLAQLGGRWKEEVDQFSAQEDYVRARLIQGAMDWRSATYEWEQDGIRWAAVVKQFDYSIKVRIAFNDGVRDHAGGGFSIETGYPVAEGDNAALYGFMAEDVLGWPRDDQHRQALYREQDEAYAALGCNGFRRVVDAVLYAVGAYLMAVRVEHPAAVA